MPLTRRALIRRGVALGLTVPAISALLAACGGDDDSDDDSTTDSQNQESPTQEGDSASKDENSSGQSEDASRLIVASGAEAVTLDPHVSFDGQSPLLWRACYEHLLTYEGSTLELIPHLAESFEVSDDGLNFSFNVRSGVKFSDGEPLNAAAVKTSIDRQVAVQMGLAYAFEPVTSIETPDDMTVELTLEVPSDGLLSGFAGLYGPYIISPKAISDNEQNGDMAQAWLRDNMVGTGPYLLKRYVQSQEAVFKRNPDYWQGWDGAHTETPIVKYVSEPATERLMLQEGEIDIALFMPDDIVEEMADQQSIRITDEQSLNLYYLALPCTKGPTADKKVRQAISYGFDYESWITDNLRGKAKQARGPIPSSFVGFASDTPQYTYDPEKAKQLLAEAGYPDGGFTLKYTYETGYAWKRPLGTLFQANMADLGITVEIQELSPATWADLLSNPDSAEHAYGVVWWPSLATPFDYLFTLFATDAQGTNGYNWGYYSNPEFDDLIYQATSEADQEKRNALYAEAQKIVVDDAPCLFIYEKNYRLPMSTEVKGFEFNSMLIETINWYQVHK